MATTRNHKQIDEALRRPGRMDRIFHLQSPTEMEREKILHNAAEETMDRELIDLVDWRKVILSCSNLFIYTLSYISSLFCTLWFHCLGLLTVHGFRFRRRHLYYDR